MATTSPQTPLGSGFDATSTASDVLAGVDLSGRTAIVTGGYSGIGLETTRALAAAGASVLVPARRREAAEEALQGWEGVEVDELDLADLDSVRAFAQRVLESGRAVDMVINSAGVMATPETRVGPGWELQLAANHLGHFALVNRIRAALADGARVVAVSSRGHHFSGFRWQDPMFEREPYDKWLAYGQSKTANVLFAVQLDTLARDRGVRAFALHPGTIITPLLRHMTEEDVEQRSAPDDEGRSMTTNMKSPEQGAATQVWAATSPALDGLGGVYLQDCDIAVPAPDDGERTGVKDWAVDAEQAARLWELSAELTGVDSFS